MTNQPLRHAAPSLGGVFGSAEYDAHEQVAHFHDRGSGLRAIIAVHSTALGPALGGRYITAEDVGTTIADMDLLRQVTRHVTGASVELGGSGDPSAATALGVTCAMRAAAKLTWGDDRLEGRHVVVVGVGKVGSRLARRLHRLGCRLTVADVDRQRAGAVAAEVGAPVVEPDAALDVACDLLAPCALSGVLNEKTIPTLRCRVVVGAANNQLAAPHCALLLHDRGILYVPDYAANAGGIINIAGELPGPYDPERARRDVERIYQTVLTVCARAAADGSTPAEAADRIAAERIAAARR